MMKTLLLFKEKETKGGDENMIVLNEMMIMMNDK